MGMSMKQNNLSMWHVVITSDKAGNRQVESCFSPAEVADRINRFGKVHHEVIAMSPIERRSNHVG